MDTLATVICADDGQAVDRLRSQMVLCAIEQGLGALFVRNASSLAKCDPVVQDIRLATLKNEPAPLTPEEAQALIAEAYLKQVFDLALVATKGTPSGDCLRELYALAEALELFEIRNAAAHPNRPFFRYFWLRVAAFAGDPRFPRLELFEVGEKLHRAFSGEIERPPERWFSNASVIPNNLPSRFEHASTGLVGREDERKRLWSDFRSPRKHFIAIVSPGGNGKTALALDFLDELTTSAQGTSLADAVVFVSLKNQYLTVSGTLSVRCSRTLEELERELATELGTIYVEQFASFSSAKERLAEKKIVLCIDNLETLLTEFPNALAPFEAELPSGWKLFVTSRIAVENASSIPLAPLKPGAARQLVRSYIASCGYPRLDEALVDAIVAGTKANPLAIKLVIDTYVGGRDITESISKAAEDTTEFSFSSLLDVLSNEAVDVMESLFVDEEISRMALVEALELSAEQVGQAIQDLCRTSLAWRDYPPAASREVIRLNEQVRQLLRLRPKRVATREKIEKYLRSQRASVVRRVVDTAEAGSAYDLNHVPDDVPVDLQVLITVTNRAVGVGRAQTHLQEAYRKMLVAESEYGSYAIYWTTRARLMWACKDHTAAYTCIAKSLELEPENFVTLRLQAEMLLNESRPAEALPILEDLRARGGADPDKCGTSFAGHLISAYLHAHIFLCDFELVNELTREWHKDQRISSFVVCARIRCFKRWAEDRDHPDQEKRLIHALNLFASAVSGHGLLTHMEAIGRELIEELLHIARVRLDRQSLEFVRASAAFIASYLRDVAGPGDSLWADAKELYPRFEKILRKPALSNGDSEAVSSDLAEDLRTNGYQVARVSHVPDYLGPGQTTFIFAVSEDGNDCFVHKSAFAKGGRIPWRDLRPGSVLAVKLVPNDRGSTKWKASDAQPVRR